jgi:glycosyltransferase involved in cell wall biosynthesis
MKVLISAYLCEPDKGSELAVGWNWVLQIAKLHDVWVLTESRWREGIEAKLARNPVPRARFVYLDLPRWALFWRRGRLGLETHYYTWQIAAYFKSRKLHKKIGFDLAHHVTLGRYWVPSFLAFLPIPFVWGPVGGGESTPRSLWKSFSLRGKILETARNVARKLGELDPFVRSTARRSTMALATTEQTAARLRALGARRVLVHPQFGMTAEERQFFGGLSGKRSGPFRVISIGRLLPYKGFHLGILAFGKLRESLPDSEYWIVNDGIEMDSLKSLAKRVSVDEKVTFWGKLPTLQDVYAKLSDSDILLHPALHEAFGNVCLEAMASGRPVICLDLGGPALQVSEETGVKVRADSLEQVVEDIASEMLRLANDSELRLAMGRAAQRRTEEHFDWNRKGEFMIQIYEDSIKEQNRPKRDDHTRSTVSIS